MYRRVWFQSLDSSQNTCGWAAQATSLASLSTINFSLGVAFLWAQKYKKKTKNLHRRAIKTVGLEPQMLQKLIRHCSSETQIKARLLCRDEPHHKAGAEEELSVPACLVKEEDARRMCRATLWWVLAAWQRMSWMSTSEETFENKMNKEPSQQNGINVGLN